jgi:hypothetical protein
MKIHVTPVAAMQATDSSKKPGISAGSDDLVSLVVVDEAEAVAERGAPSCCSFPFPAFEVAAAVVADWAFCVGLCCPWLASFASWSSIACSIVCINFGTFSDFIRARMSSSVNVGGGSGSGSGRYTSGLVSTGAWHMQAFMVVLKLMRRPRYLMAHSWSVSGTQALVAVEKR